jgi:predicted ATPase
MRALRAAAAHWPLVGRGEELAFVREALGGGGAGLVLAGAAGVGKTRLAAEVVREAEAAGYATAWAVGTRGAAAIPFGALAHLLPVSGPVSTSPLDLMRRLARALVERADGRRLVIGVDDAHLLDGPSAALLQQLAATGVAFVVVTLRSGEPAPDPIVALWKDGPVEYLEVQPLSSEDVERLVGEALGGEVDGGPWSGFGR